MADYFVDSVNGSDANNGTTMDLAFATIDYATSLTTFTAGDTIWIRRNVQELPTSDVSLNDSGTTASPMRLIGCPRNTISITSSDWTNGSTTVTIDDGGMTEAAHEARMIQAPDGNLYFISRVQSSTGITILNEYTGATVTNQAATIQADEDYDLFNAINDSAWTIKKSNWNADSHSLASIDFNDGAYSLTFSGTNWVIKNLLMMDSSDANGILLVNAVRFLLIVGCIIKQSASNTRLTYFSGAMNSIFQQCVIKGSGSGSAQIGIYIVSTSVVSFKNVALYNMGGNALNGFQLGFLDNVNIGIEQANAGYDINTAMYYMVRCRNLRMGGTNGFVSISTSVSPKIGPPCTITIENYQTLGSHRTYYAGGYWMNQSMPDSTDVLKKLSDQTIKIVPNGLSGYVVPVTMSEFHTPVFTAVISATTLSQSYRVWIYNRAMGTLNDTTAKDNIWMQVEYIKSYDDTSEYVVGTSASTQIDIANSANSSDWDYLEVTNVAPSVADKVRITVYVNAYHATGMIYIDPKVVIS
jgi:hypothetical protein